MQQEDHEYAGGSIMISDLRIMNKHDLEERLNSIAEISAYYGSLCVLSDIMKSIDYEKFPSGTYFQNEMEEQKKYALNEIEKSAEEIISYSGGRNRKDE